VEVSGDLKLDPDAVAPAPSPELAAVLGAVPLIVAGSTHEGEEEAALAALAAAHGAGLPAALVLAPRHPERFEAVARLVAARALPLRRRSRLEARPLAAGEVLLLDGIGELAGLYAGAALAFVGGSLVPRGGHNLVEPALAGRAPVFGPHTANSRDVAELLLAADGAQRVADAAGLARCALEALRAPSAEAARGARAAAALAPHRGATQRSVALLERVRARRGGA
jgi:3-deoxy-D-manno-octulosonic-acid transferase